MGNLRHPFGLSGPTEPRPERDEELAEVLRAKPGGWPRQGSVFFEWISPILR